MSWVACSRACRATLVCFLLGALACAGREAPSSADARSCSDHGAIRPNNSSWLCSGGCSTCSCDNGEILSTAPACGDGGLAQEAAAGDESDAGAMPEYDGSCSIIDQRCVDLQPQIQCSNGQWLDFGQSCTELCRDANCAYVCNPPCDAGSVCFPFTPNNMCVYPMR
jgi:hypothetical protein